MSASAALTQGDRCASVEEEATALQRWADDGGPTLAVGARENGGVRIGEGPTNGGKPSSVGGLLVIAGYGEERLGYLAAILSESLAEALWIPPPASEVCERGHRIALIHLAAGTSVVQVAATELQVLQFKDLAEHAGARFLLVRATPPRGSGESDSLPAVSGEDRLPWPRVVVQAKDSLATQLHKVLAVWNHPFAPR